MMSLSTKCMIQLYTNPAPPPKEGFRRIWTNTPTPHWEYRYFSKEYIPVNIPFSSYVKALSWQFDNPVHDDVEKIEVKVLIAEHLMKLDIYDWEGEEGERGPDTLEWNNEYETWTPSMGEPRAREGYLHLLSEEPKSISIQLQRRHNDYINYMYKMCQLRSEILVS